MKKTLLTIGLLIAACSSLLAQFTLSGMLRPRAEYRNGYSHMPINGTSAAFFVSNRVRLTADYKSDNMQFRMTAQEIRVWGNQVLKSDNATLGLYEAWGKISVAGGLSLKIGRQELSYDNQRLLSHNNFRQSGQSHDALIFLYQKNGWDLHLAGAYNQQKENTFNTWYNVNDPKVRGNYKTLNFIYARKKFGALDFNLLAIADGLPQNDTTNKTFKRYTFGPSLSYAIGLLTLKGRTYYQTGKIKTGKDVTAWYINLEAFIKASSKITINPGLDVLSGNDLSKTDGMSRAFSTLYGAGHAPNGHIDYFTNVEEQTKGAGLNDLYLKAGVKLSDKTDFYADYHYFLLQNDYKVAGKEINKYLGSELDLGFSIKFAKDINLQLGYSFMLANESMKYFKEGNPDKYADWGWVMLTINPTFLVSGK
ncbi:MAG: alginate export family protein [Bacteroidales bacterium]|nr:alginate export family protein [Bacteroidales bacterium]MDZ4205566.1 alginate export family protein [Bacteroidales bacterium]